jgi:hypothetical protein
MASVRECPLGRRVRPQADCSPRQMYDATRDQEGRSIPMSEITVVIGAGQIGQAIARRVSAGKHIVLADPTRPTPMRQPRCWRTSTRPTPMRQPRCWPTPASMSVPQPSMSPRAHRSTHSSGARRSVVISPGHSCGGRVSQPGTRGGDPRCRSVRNRSRPRRVRECHCVGRRRGRDRIAVRSPAGCPDRRAGQGSCYHPNR